MFAIDGIDRAEFETLLRVYGKECAREALREAGAVLTPTLSCAEVADLLGFASVDSVHRLVKASKLPAKRQGRSFRFLRSDVDAYLRQRDETA